MIRLEHVSRSYATTLAVDDVIVSPTFTLARRYPGRVPLVHVDLYRLARVQELIDLGLEEEGDDAVTVIEWGDVASAHLPSDRLEVHAPLEPQASSHFPYGFVMISSECPPGSRKYTPRPPKCRLISPFTRMPGSAQ